MQYSNSEQEGPPPPSMALCRIAADAVGAGVGERVLVAQGSSGRQTAITKGKAVDAVIMAIVDRLDVDEDARVAAEAA